MLGRIRIAAVAGCLAACTSLPKGDGSPRPDHILLGAADLELAVHSVMEQTGARAARGGSHPGLGTRNALLSLGDGSYLEIIAPDPAQEATAFSRELAALKSPTPIGWAIRADDLDAVNARLVAANVPVGTVEPGSRRLPNGALLEWRAMELEVSDPIAPFFIAWGRSTVHPARHAPAGCRADDVHLGGAVSDALAEALKAGGEAWILRPGAPSGLHFALVCPGGTMRF